MKVFFFEIFNKFNKFDIFDIFDYKENQIFLYKIIVCALYFSLIHIHYIKIENYELNIISHLKELDENNDK